VGTGGVRVIPAGMIAYRNEAISNRFGARAGPMRILIIGP